MGAEGRRNIHFFVVCNELCGGNSSFAIPYCAVAENDIGCWQKMMVQTFKYQVVSIEDVPIMFGSVSFQSNDVRGAQYSLFEFCACAGKAA